MTRWLTSRTSSVRPGAILFPGMVLSTSSPDPAETIRSTARPARIRWMVAAGLIRSTIQVLRDWSSSISPLVQPTTMVMAVRMCCSQLRVFPGPVLPTRFPAVPAPIPSQGAEVTIFCVVVGVTTSSTVKPVWILPTIPRPLLA